MTIDYSILTTIIFILVVIFTFGISYSKCKNLKRAICQAIFYYSIIMLVYFVILPLQLGSVDGIVQSSVNISFVDNFVLYSNTNWLMGIATGIIFSASGYLLHKRMRNPIFVLAVSIAVLIMYVVDGLIANFYWHDCIKLISIIDMAMLIVGIVIGFISATAFCKYNTNVIKYLKKSNSRNKNESYKDMSEL